MSSARIAVYFLDLEPEPARLDYFYESLSKDERERAARFHFGRHRRAFIACRGAVREILGSWLETPPATLRFAYNRYGKPALVHSDLRFNVSHSGAHGLLAVSADLHVGVDIERVDAGFASGTIPERFFSPSEVRQLRALPSPEQTAAFFRCWTRKEAYIKARGMGLSLRLDSFDVTLAPGAAPAFLRGARGWTVQDVTAPEGFAAAVVAEGAGWNCLIHPFDADFGFVPRSPQAPSEYRSGGKEMSGLSFTSN